MSYKPPITAHALRLLAEIRTLLQESGGYYINGVNSYAEASILCCLATGQFVYKKGSYFVNWYFLDDITLKKHQDKDSSFFEHIPSYDITSGQHMRVMECGILDTSSMAEIRRKLRKRGRAGISWYREKTGKQILHSKQRGN